MSARIMLIMGLFLILPAVSFPKNIDQGMWDICSQIEGRLPPVTNKQKLTMVILDFTDLDGGSSEVGKLVAEELITRLSKNSKLNVIERKLLKKIISENKLSLSGVIDENTAKQLGKILGAELICSGTVAVLRDKARVNARVIRAETGELVSTGGTELDDPSIIGGDNTRHNDQHDNYKPQREQRRLGFIDSMQLPRMFPANYFSSRVIVSDIGVNVEMLFGLWGSFSFGISETVTNLMGGGNVSLYIPSLHLKYLLVNDINKLNLAIGWDTFAYSSYTIKGALTNFTNGVLPFDIQGLYLSMGWTGFSIFGENDMFYGGIRFPVLPYQLVLTPFFNVSLFAGVTVGITKYFVVGLSIEDVNFNLQMLPTLSISFTPINDIDISLILHYELWTGNISRTLTFGYEYGF